MHLQQTQQTEGRADGSEGEVSWLKEFFKNIFLEEFQI